MSKVPLEPEGEDETLTSRTTRREEEQARAAALMFQRAKQFCLDNRLMRVEVETPSGRLTVYKDPALFLEAFAADEVLRDRREQIRGRGSRK